MNNNFRPLDIHQKVVDFIDAGCSFVIAVVLNTDGSTPQKTGAKAIIEPSGRIWGTIGGGVVEDQGIHRAIDACKLKHPLVFDCLLEGAHALGTDAICGGRMRILLDPEVQKYRSCYLQALHAQQLRRPGALLTVIRHTEPPQVSVMWWNQQTQQAQQPQQLEFDFPPLQALHDCLARQTAQFYPDHPQATHIIREALIEPLLPQPQLLVCGGGHIGQALARQAQWVDFEVVVIDDRPEFTHPDLFPRGVQTHCGDIASFVREFPTAADTFIVIVTRQHQYDQQVLQTCIHAPAAYIGMIGSRRKVALIRENFIHSGVASPEEFNRVFAPVGLDLGAVTVPEIAASIVAQLIAVRRKGPAYTPPGDMVNR